MPIEHIPSFWDYLNQGLMQGDTAYNQSRAVEQAKQQQQFQNLATLYSMGAADSGTLNANPVFQKMGVTVQPSQPEMRRGIIARDAAPNIQVPTGISNGPVPVTVPVKTAKPVSDTERVAAGLPTEGQLAESQVASRKAKAILAMASGQPLDDNMAAAFGLKTPGDLEAERMTKIDPLVGQAAERHVATVINGLGGRIDSKNIRTIADMAFQNYLQQRAVSRLGRMTPQEQEYARSFFSKAVLDAYERQRMLDNQEAAAHARYAGLNIGQNRNYLEAIQKQQAAVQAQMKILEADGILKYYIDNPNIQVPEVLQGRVDAYKELQDRLSRLQDAYSEYAGSSGLVAPDIAGAFSSSGEPVKRPVSGGTAAPAPAPTKSKQSPVPKKIVPADDSGNIKVNLPKRLTKAQLNTAKSLLDQMTPEARNAYIERGLNQGHLHPADAALLRQ